MTPHRPAPDTTAVWSPSASIMLAGLLMWSDDEDCDACAWACDPATWDALGERWGGPCPYHLGTEDGFATATDWDPDDYPGWFGWRRAARRLAGVALAASHGVYSPRARRAARDTMWDSQ